MNTTTEPTWGLSENLEFCGGQFKPLDFDPFAGVVGGWTPADFGYTRISRDPAAAIVIWEAVAENETTRRFRYVVMIAPADEWLHIVYVGGLADMLALAPQLAALAAIVKHPERDE